MNDIVDGDIKDYSDKELTPEERRLLRKLVAEYTFGIRFISFFRNMVFWAGVAVGALLAWKNLFKGPPS